MNWPILQLLLLPVAFIATGCNARVPKDDGSPSRSSEAAQEPVPTNIAETQIEADADSEPKAPRLGVEIDRDGKQVLRKDDSGKAIWSTPLEGYLGGVRPPHLLLDAERVYVTQDDAVTALDSRSGKVLWHSAGPQDSMYLGGDLLLAADCGMSDDIERRGRLVMARDVKTGEEKFRVGLPQDNSFDPEPI